MVREAGERVLGMRHFDVQLIGGMALHEGKIAEMRTGEGKTLVATLPAYLNALTGNGVHLITVNDYLATRDAGWMGPLYEFLGVSVGVIRSGQSAEQKSDAYSADIIYGTNNEFGFDYLRDNMAFTMADRMQGQLAFAIVDEVDSILIDEARTPLIISGPAEDRSELYVTIDKLIPQVQDEHFTLDEKTRQATFTDEGNDFLEEQLRLAGVEVTHGKDWFSICGELEPSRIRLGRQHPPPGAHGPARSLLRPPRLQWCRRRKLPHALRGADRGSAKRREPAHGPTPSGVSPLPQRRGRGGS